MLRRLQEQNHYQVLELPSDANSDEIQAAYEAARDMYSHDALVTSSILTENERRRTFERISEAYQTLIAEESRRLYDQQLGLQTKSVTLVESPPPSPVEAAPEADTMSGGVTDEAQQESSPSEETPSAEAPRRCPIQLAASEEASGDFLRRAREALGLELSTISEETKIGRSMLEYIETERTDRLPAPVYLRNFTRQIAVCLGLDEEHVSRTYLERIARAGG